LHSEPELPWRDAYQPLEVTGKLALERARSGPNRRGEFASKRFLL
jgi:hypothetical protein